MNTRKGKTDPARVEMAFLSVDLKRILRVQLKEFIHLIEDVEFEQGRIMFAGISNTATLNKEKASLHVA